MKLEIDSSACTGHGRCYSIAPALFDSDDDGYGVVRLDNLDRSDLEVAEKAVASCPEQAIRLT